MKRILGLVGTVVVGGVVGTVIGMVHSLDEVITFALLFAVAVGVLIGIGWWVKGAVSEWWAVHDPNPTAPLREARYWPGSKADVAQKAATEKAARERKDRDAA